MTTMRQYEEVSCPTCGALPGECCISKKSGQKLEVFNEKRRRGHKSHYAHAERMAAYKRDNKPLAWTGWPIGRL
jgi:hypothetical protein